jgi:molybdopterin molybdotransferase
VYARPVVGVLSTGDELVEPSEMPGPGQVRDSNRYAIAGALLAMGAQPRHYPKVGDEPGELETMLAKALDECDAVAVTGGSSVGERDRLPQAVAALGDPGIVVHGLRIKPGKPALLGARGTKPILGLPGNPSSALIVLEAVASPILAALGGTVPHRRAFSARLAEPVRSRPGWTWYIPVAVGDDAGGPVAHPLAIRSFSVSLTARADGYITMGEADDCWPAGTTVAVHRFAGG